MISAATPQWRRLRALDELREGPDLEVRLDLRRAGASTSTTSVRVERSVPSNVHGVPEERRPAKLSEVAPGIWYLDLTRSADEDWVRAIDRLTRVGGIVFDLRGYTTMERDFLRHLTGQPLHSAKLGVPTLLRPDREGMTFRFTRWTLPPIAPRMTDNVAFLTDARAISYSETLLDIVEHYHLGAIAGGATAGTNGDINPFTLPGGYRINWTGMRVFEHDGSPHHGIGIQPTVPVARTISGIRAGRDEVLEKAIALLSGRAAKLPSHRESR